MSHQNFTPLVWIDRTLRTRSQETAPGHAQIQHHGAAVDILFVEDSQAPSGYRYYVRTIDKSTEFTDKHTFTNAYVQALVSSGATYTDREPAKPRHMKLVGRRHPHYVRETVPPSAA